MEMEVRMIEFLKSGGLTMIPLGLCSILAVAVIIEKFFTLKRKKIIPEKNLSTIDAFIEEGMWKKADEFCAEGKGVFYSIISTAIENRNSSEGELKSALEETGKDAAIILEKRLGLLGTITAVAPLLGFFGTVTGMIRIFNVLSVEGAGTQSLAGGIAEALITTVTGLAIAIPCLVAHNYFNHKVDESVRYMENYSLKLIKKIKSNKVSNAVSKDRK
jgi:biopolymer transport protein ExbB